MYYLKSSKIVSSILIALGLVITLAHLDSRVGATNRSLPFHLQARVQSEPPASAPRVTGKIAFSSTRNGYSTSVSDIYAVNIDGTDVTRLTANTAGADDISPAWSPDGSRIAFTVIRSGDAPSIYVMNPDGSNRTRLTSSGYDYLPAWSPDGTKIAFN